MSTRSDPNSIFRDLFNESQGEGTNKTASDNGTSPFAPGFFGKLANDAEAQAELAAYSEQRVAEGATDDEIASEIGEFEAQEMADGGEGSGDAIDDGDDADLSEFELAKEAAEAEAADQAFLDAIAGSDLAEALGIDEEKVAQFLVDEAAGVAYAQAYFHANEIIEKIASFVLPSDEDLAASIAFLKQAGIDTSDLSVQDREFQKQANASSQGESQAQQLAREAAAFEQNMIDSLAALQAGGFDITKVAADADGKKKLSTGAKAALGIGAVAGAAALGLGGANKALGGRFSAIQGARALGRGGMAGVSAGRSIMAGNKNVKIRDGVAAATKDGLSAARRAAKSKR